jgi:hypothetical protein
MVRNAKVPADSPLIMRSGLIPNACSPNGLTNLGAQSIKEQREEIEMWPRLKCNQQAQTPISKTLTIRNGCVAWFAPRKSGWCDENVGPLEFVHMQAGRKGEIKGHSIVRRVLRVEGLEKAGCEQTMMKSNDERFAPRVYCSSDSRALANIVMNASEYLLLEQVGRRETILDRSCNQILRQVEQNVLCAAQKKKHREKDCDHTKTSTAASVRKYSSIPAHTPMTQSLMRIVHGLGARDRPGAGMTADENGGCGKHGSW